ncbi:MAG: cupin [Actinobacteria bacterium]|nr:MAG: cupin [Actinomycetota bacterium]
MPTLISTPALIPVPGGKLIAEFVGRVASGDTGVSIAQMSAPAGWHEPAQTPLFDEFTVVLEGAVLVETAEDVFTVTAGQAIITRAGERSSYSCPGGARYLAVCLPAFGPDLVQREEH